MPSNSERRIRADLFCRIVDNFGDIGVCWRLARRLAHGHGWAVRLWVDDLATFTKLTQVTVDSHRPTSVHGVEVVHWADTPSGLQAGENPARFAEPGDVVIEAFACDPPPDFVKRLDARHIWLNLEYLSAEPWVESCHGLPSPQPNGVAKHFFFPGFTPATGGLLREPDLLAQRDAFQADPAALSRFLRQIGLPQEDTEAILAGECDLVTLFCYRDAPVSHLHRALSVRERPSVLAVADGSAVWLQPGRSGSTRVARLPFLSQDDFDRLLWSAHINFVRGEDSFVRAQWAGRPLVWHIYPQDEAAHLDKLEAWLMRYPADEQIVSAHRAWNGAGDPERIGALLGSLLAPVTLAQWRTRANDWSTQLASQPELADQLADYCTGRLES